MDLNKKFKLNKIFWVITLILFITMGFSSSLPISGGFILIFWLIAYFFWLIIMIDNKTSMQKDPKTGEWKEVTIKKSAIEVSTEIQRADEEARKKYKLRQKQLIEKGQRKIREQQQKEKSKIEVGKVEGAGLIAKVKRLKKLYINGALTKSEFEQAKNKLLN